MTVTCGVTEAVIAALMGTVNPGDNVIVLEPAHEDYHAGVAFAGGVPVWVPLRPPDYRFDTAELARAFQRGARAILFNSPHNPSGRVFTEEELKTIREVKGFGVSSCPDSSETPSGSDAGRFRSIRHVTRGATGQQDGAADQNR